jgi:hypothetical protein
MHNAILGGGAVVRVDCHVAAYTIYYSTSTHHAGTVACSIRAPPQLLAGLGCWLPLGNAGTVSSAWLRA